MKSPLALALLALLGSSSLPAGASDAYYLGLFGLIGKGGSVSNLKLVAVSVAGGERYTGTLAGYNAGTLTDCQIQGIVGAAGASAKSPGTTPESSAAAPAVWWSQADA